MWVLVRRGLGILALALLVQACATMRPSSPAASPAASAELAALRARDISCSSLSTAAIMDYRGPSGRFKAREQLAVRRPSSLRVEVLTPLGVALVVVVNGGQLAIFDPGKNTITRGAADAAALDRVARIPLAPEQSVRLLLGLPPDPPGLSATPASVAVQPDMTVMRFAVGDHLDELGFTGDNLAMVKRSSQSATLYQVHYSDYRDIGALIFPHEIVADFPAAATQVKLTYQSPLVDAAIPDSEFVVQPHANTRELQFDANGPSGAS